MRNYSWLTLGALGAASCASPHTLTSAHASNPAGYVELENAVGLRPPVAPGQLLVRYLRAGGVYFEWHGEALMTAPFASNYPLLANRKLTRYRARDQQRRRGDPFRTLFDQRIRPDRDAIDFVLGHELRFDRVRSLLVGHSHYDHLGDVPDLMTRKLPRATLYANQSAQNMLAGERELAGRIVVLSECSGWLTPAANAASAIRFRPIRSGHAPNFDLFGQTFAWATGTVDEPWSTPLAGHALDELKAGTTYAFLVDFLDPADPTRVAFRVHYQDAASTPPEGYPPVELLAERGVDLEVVSMPGRETLRPSRDRYPAGVLRHNRARHALVIHYESFFHPVLDGGRPGEVLLLDTLRGETSEEFLDSVARSVEGSPCGAPRVLEGLRAETFTVPLPGEWLVFDTLLSDANCR
ncbi:MAG TPA: hypothetical protein VFU02_09050 [Polyangiaceae bacterium]|nr:hypothetical protein [Polyangiaceae bacterium]